MKSSAKALTFLLAVAPGFAQADAAVEKVDTAAKKCSEKCPGYVYNGFSVGLDLIYHMTEVKHQDAVSVLKFIDQKNQVGERSTSGTESAMHKRYRFDPAINLGYSYFRKGFYAGLSGDVAFGDKNRRSQSFFGDAIAKTKIDGISYGVKAKLGGYIRGIKSVVYAIAGVKWRNIEFQYYVKDDKTNKEELGSKAKLKTPTFVVGAGFDRLIRDKWSLTGEYEYSWRNSTDSSVVSNEVGSSTVNVSQRLREHSLRIGVKYHF